MRDNIKKYYNFLEVLISKIESTDIEAKKYEFDEAVDISIREILDKTSSGGRLFFIGNGASASISSHIATDFWKNGGIRSHAFNDSSLLTCVSNDYGYKHVFEKPIEMFMEPGDILIAISSSGNSENILRGVCAAKKKNAKIITLSGFKDDNPLRKTGDINFYVPASEYGYVEVVHLSICHCLVDMIIKAKNG